MGIDVSLAEGGLDGGDRRRLTLPEIRLSATPDNLPHLRKLEMFVEGEPASLVQKVQRAYRTFWSPRHPIALSSAKKVKPSPVQAKVSGPFSLRLRVDLEFHDSDADGQPITHIVRETSSSVLDFGSAEDKEGSKEDASELQRTSDRATSDAVAQTAPPPPAPNPSPSGPSPSGPSPSSPSPPNRGVRLEVVPSRVTWVHGEEHPGFHIRLLGAKDATVDVVVEPPEDKAKAPLIDALRKALGDGWSSLPDEDGWSCYRSRLSVNLDDELPASVRFGSPFEIPVSFRVDGRVLEKGVVEVRGGTRYPGWAVLDFGTSSSTVTLHDPKAPPRAQGLPQEQEVVLNQAVRRWLTRQVPPHREADWHAYLGEVAARFRLDRGASLAERIERGESRDLYATLKELELALSMIADAEFRDECRESLFHVYHQAFRHPPLMALRLLRVVLDGATGGYDIPSEVEIQGIGEDHVRELLMGTVARSHRESAVAQATVEELRDIRGRFHPSPKRHLGASRNLWIHDGTKSATISVSELVQSTLGHLLDLTLRYKAENQGRLAHGSVEHVVATYPTVAPPMVRQELAHLISDLGYSHVSTDYDEATSAAIFHLMCEFGGAFETGLESFRARSRKRGAHWFQNVLVLDIGGGTTDLALLRLTMKETSPFEGDEDRGLGGRYYTISPKILGSSGHMQLGGDLITVRLFKLIKAAIADKLLSLTRDGHLESPTLQGMLGTLDERFLEKGEFVSGSLIAAMDKDLLAIEEDPVAQQALEVAERVLPTRWAESPDRLQAFYALWEIAERAKLAFSAHDKDPLVLSFADIEALMAQTGHPCPPLGEDVEGAMGLSPDRLRRAVRPVIAEAVSIARGLLEGRLPRDMEGRREPLDWLILSGKSCHMSLVRDEIMKTLSRSKHIEFNASRITFDPEFAKSATSIGACYAEELRGTAFHPEGAKSELRKGRNQLLFEIRNLFYFLPCAFQLKAAELDKTILLFEANKPLRRIDDPTRGKARSTWQAAQLRSTIYRQDYEDGQLHLWGSFPGDALMKRIGLDENVWRRDIRVQFEVDHRLDVRIFLCRGKPHHTFDHRPLFEGDMVGMIEHVDGHPSTRGALILNAFPSGEVGAEGDGVTVFAESCPLDRVFEVGGPSRVRGLVSAPLPPFPIGGEHRVYVATKGEEPRLVGTLAEPSKEGDYPCDYYLTLDERNVLQLHVGQVPYRTSENCEVLRDDEGAVYARSLDMQPRLSDQNRDPHSGHH